MAKIDPDFDSDSYPWDSLWEYILDDRNFEETEPKKKRWSATTRRRGQEEGYDSDSAYDEDDIRRDRERTRIEKSHPPTQKLSKTSDREKSKKYKRFVGWLRRGKRKDKREQEQDKMAEIPRENFKVQVEDEDGEKRTNSGLSRVPSFLRRRDDEVSVSGNQSVHSETSSVFRILQWGKTRDVETDSIQNLSDNDDDSDEISVMESLFNFEDSRSDFDVDDRNRYRAKQKWRKAARERHHDPREIARSISDLFDSREVSSVRSSHSRRNPRYGYRDQYYNYEAQPIISDDISVVNYLLETQGGYFVHVPSSIAVGSRRPFRRKSLHGTR